ncbi:MAG TPA: secondary thiamine-phosphate synthase enzyme YjbQ [Candidatus Bathyarchaeia archaeon]|nr:secondary thiamine-phosphate synthase enzyme YjbQ [Candidatus Bathyarchaeia archaeon]
MVTQHHIISFSSRSRREFIDITSQVVEIVQRSAVKEGICVISAPHATTAILVNENEQRLIDDMLAKIEELFPSSALYSHNSIDDNADAHLAAVFIGHSKTFPISKRKLVRGTWQSIFLIELDGPRQKREVHIQTLGDI